MLITTAGREHEISLSLNPNITSEIANKKKLDMRMNEKTEKEVKRGHHSLSAKFSKLSAGK